MCSLRLVFTNILDINHLSKEIGALRKAKSLSSALSYLKRQFSVPIDIELPAEGTLNFLPCHHIDNSAFLWTTRSTSSYSSLVSSS